MFCEFGADKNGRLGKREIQAALTKAGVVVSDDELRAFIFHVDSDKDGIIKFGEWSEFLLFSPKKNFTIRHIYSFYLNIIHQSDTGDQILIPETSSRPPVVTFKYLIAGGIAGAISRTVTAPLDRIRVLLICKTSTDAAATLTAGVPSNNLSVFGNLRHFVGTMRDIMRVIYADGGLSAFWRGNGVNIIKIIPESAIRFYVFESCKRLLKSSRLREERNQATATSQSGTTPTEKGSLVIHASNFTTAERMIAGGAAGFASQFVIYPLETIKTRMMANLTQTTITSSMNEHTSAIRTAATMFKQDGFRAFFRGLGPSLLGIIPYASIDLTAYETLKQTYYQISGDRKPSTAVHLVCGATAGALSATVVYPLGLIRTRLQAQGTSTHQQRYPGGAIDVIRTTYRKESLRGFYKGLSPSLLKVIPAVSISYICYEEAKQRLQIS